MEEEYNDIQQKLKMAQIIHDVLATSIQRENERIEKEKAEAVENKKPKEE